jgi:hypothetical protein
LLKEIEHLSRHVTSRVVRDGEAQGLSDARRSLLSSSMRDKEHPDRS